MHVESCDGVLSDAGSTPAASTIRLAFVPPTACRRLAHGGPQTRRMPVGGNHLGCILRGFQIRLWTYGARPQRRHRPSAIPSIQFADIRGRRWHASSVRCESSSTAKGVTAPVVWIRRGLAWGNRLACTPHAAGESCEFRRNLGEGANAGVRPARTSRGLRNTRRERSGCGEGQF